jgi:NLI interacting factor-like phosphatase
MLGRPLQDIVILDNSPMSYLFQPHHAIPISTWYSDPKDQNLYLLIPALIDMAQRVEREGFKAAPLSYHLKRVKQVLIGTPPEIVNFTELPIIGNEWVDLLKIVKKLLLNGPELPLSITNETCTCQCRHTKPNHPPDDVLQQALPTIESYQMVTTGGFKLVAPEKRQSSQTVAPCTFCSILTSSTIMRTQLEADNNPKSKHGTLKTDILKLPMHLTIPSIPAPPGPPIEHKLSSSPIIEGNLQLPPSTIRQPLPPSNTPSPEGHCNK